MKPLRYRGSVLALIAVALLATAAFANVFLLDFYGYDYWSPLTMPLDTPGNCYNALGYVPSVNPAYLTFDYGNNEYTFSLQNVCISGADTLGTVVIYYFSGGTFDVYGDDLGTGTEADFGVSPPNATAPATFEDGDNVVGGDLANLQIVVDLISGNADLYGEINLTRGSQLGNIPVEQRSGWTLAGLRAGAPGTPVGYFWQIDGQLFIEPPVAVEPQSWGSLKNRFKGGN
jgi:hypothetical protein